MAFMAFHSTMANFFFHQRLLEFFPNNPYLKPQNLASFYIQRNNRLRQYCYLPQYLCNGLKICKIIQIPFYNRILHWLSYITLMRSFNGAGRIIPLSKSRQSFGKMLSALFSELHQNYRQLDYLFNRRH